MALGLQFSLEGEQILLNPYFPLLLEGLSAAAVKEGYSFVLLPAHRSSGFPLEAVLGTQRLDAAILVDPQNPNELIPALREHHVPIVTLGRFLGRAPTHWVDNDHADAIGRAVDHVLEAGYRQPALVSISGIRVSYVADIEAGYRSAAASRGFAPLIARGEISEHSGYDAGISLLTRRRRPDAILAATDRQAIGILAAAAELGVRVPGDLGVVGEGNTPLARNARPSLTSLDSRPEELGRATIELIGRILDRPPASPERVVVPAALVARRSTGRGRP
jgi:DNA-binding LacI/PurR family transcriptional regulator